MKKLLSAILTLSLLSFSIELIAAPPVSLDKKINTLIKQDLPHAAVGVIIRDAKTGKIVYQKNAQQNFYMASNQKLLTSAAALKKLGPDFKFQTTMSVANNNLYLAFNGDPSFKAQDLLQMLSDLKAKGLNQITGNIIIDDSAFSGPHYGPGWTYESIPWYYSAPSASIIINENKIAFTLEKATQLQSAIPVKQVDMDLPTLPISANVIAVTQAQADTDCQLDLKVNHNHVDLQGCWPLESTPKTLEIATDSPRELLVELLKVDLQKLNIAFAGKFEFAKVPSDLIPLVVKNSAELKSLLIPILADSNNIYSESLAKTLGKQYKQQGTFQAGAQAIRKILRENYELDISDIRVIDGSGGSRYNTMTPYLVSNLLLKMKKDPNYPAFHAALSKSGISGTLESRMQESLKGKVIAKTGTARGVSALSGYLTAKNGKEYVFSVVINHYTNDGAKLKAFEDKVCAAVYQS